MRRIILILFTLFCAVPSFAVIPHLVGTRFAVGAGTTGSCPFASPFGADGGTDIVFAFRQSVTGGWASPGVTGTTSLWQYLSNNGSANQLDIAIRRHAQTGGTTAIAVAFSPSATFAGNCLEYINVQDVDQISSTNSATILDGANIVFPSITTSCTNTIVIGYAGLKPTTGTGAVFTVNDGTWTAEGYTTGGSQTEIQQDKTFAAAGTYTPSTVASSKGGEYVSQTISLLTTSSVCSGWPVAYRVPAGPVANSSVIGSDQGYSPLGVGAGWSACYDTGSNSPCPDTTHQFWFAMSAGIDSNGFPTGAVTAINVSTVNAGSAPCTMTQLNGIYYWPSNTHIYLGINRFPTDNTGCIAELDNTGSFVAAHTVETFATEGAEYVPQWDAFAVFYVGSCRLSLYDKTTWALIGDIGLPVENGDCTNSWQSFSCDPQTGACYANPHNNNADHNVYVYFPTGSPTAGTAAARYLGKFAQYFESGTGNGTGQQLKIYGNKFVWVNRNGLLPSFLTTQQLTSLTQSNWWAQ